MTKDGTEPTIVEQILDQARWAPSGDNTQTWSFEILSDHQIVVHGRRISEDCVYDLEGHAAEIALGALLETLSIAATGFGLRAESERRQNTPADKPTFDVTLVADDALHPDALIPCIPLRSVQRRPLKTRALTAEEKAALERAVGPGYSILWLEGLAKRFQAAHLMFRNAWIRLIIPEAYREHKKVIQWNAQFSEDRIPDQALGTDPLLTQIMRWAMGNWKRIDFLNRYAAGTLLARLEMDLLPGVACGAHFVLMAPTAPKSSDDYVAAGRALQRFWLTATSLGLQLQPEQTPLIFRGYVKRGFHFTTVERAWKRAEQLADDLEELIGEENADRAVYLGRIGDGPPARARSLRKPLAELLMKQTRPPLTAHSKLTSAGREAHGKISH